MLSDTANLTGHAHSLRHQRVFPATCCTGLQELPPGLGGLRRLMAVCVRGNPLRQPYQRVLDVRGERGLLSLLRPEGEAGTLDMDGCGFELLPPEVCNLTGRGASLAALVLTNNRLVDLPKVRCVCLLLLLVTACKSRLMQVLAAQLSQHHVPRQVTPCE